MCLDICVDMCMNMCMAMCTDMITDICLDLRIEMTVDQCLHMCIDMYISMCTGLQFFDGPSWALACVATGHPLFRPRPIHCVRKKVLAALLAELAYNRM